MTIPDELELAENAEKAACGTPASLRDPAVSFRAVAERHLQEAIVRRDVWQRPVGGRLRLPRRFVLWLLAGWIERDRRLTDELLASHAATLEAIRDIEERIAHLENDADA